VCSGSVGVSEAEDSQKTWKVEKVEEMRDGGNGAKGGIIYYKMTARKLLQARGNSCVMAYKAGRHGQPLCRQGQSSSGSRLGASKASSL
jgi:hypothetical protein